MASSFSALQPSKEKTNGTRLRRLLLDGGTQVLRNLLDSIHSPQALPGVLKQHEYLKKRCFEDQISLLFPSDKQPDSKQFDITLLSLLLTTICGLDAPTTGWKKKPADDDRSKEANIVRIRNFRNKIQHLPDSGVEDENFNELWEELSATLAELGFPERLIKRLKIAPIEDESEIQNRFQRWCDKVDAIEKTQEHLQGEVKEQGKKVEVIEGRLKELSSKVKQSEKQTEDHTLSLEGYIPDKPDKFVGRTKIIKQIVEFLSKKETSVFVSGSPGIGKSTLVKRVSWELREKHRQTVFYVELWKCKESSEEEISKALVSVVCSGRTETKPIDALKTWLRNLQTKVILVIDDAGVLDDTRIFTETLMKIRQNSRQRVSFLIASREKVELEMKIIELVLERLTEGESVEVIDLHSSGKYFSSSTNFEQKREIAKLCGYTPLALCIATCLLDDLEASELIEQLEAKTMDVLKGQVRGVRFSGVKEAIDLSFEKLDNALREYFVQITVFAGPFTAKSVGAVTDLEKTEVLTEFLGKLVRKSLLRKEKNKYSIHPLIHAYVKDYGKRKQPEKLEKSQASFVTYYVSLFLENSNLYWERDGYKEAVSNVQIDRVNFEKALKLSCLNSGSRDNLKAVWIERNTFKELRNVALYLQSCISLDLLEKVINCFISLCEKNGFVGQQLELVCLKGHILRRKSGNEEYEKIVEQSDTLFEKCKDSLDDCSLVYYKSAKARKLGHEERREEAMKDFQDVIKICKRIENPNMADYAKAVLELGLNLKCTNHYKDALIKHQDAIEIYKNHLGKHTLTAKGLKDLANCYMKMEEFDEALKYNKEALAMLHDLNSGSSDTHIFVLLYKNIGVCYRMIKNYQESEEHLKQAEEMADKNFSGDHQYAFRVEAELAILYGNMDRKEDAKSLARKALEMGERLNLKKSGWKTYKTTLKDILEMQE